MSDETSARLALPLLQAGQAQKEVYHNEALARLDLAVQASVVALAVNSPPTSPAIGACWIVGTAPTGAWSAAVDCLAGWTTGGWRFVAPTEGMRVWVAGEAVEARFSGGSWTKGEVRADRLVVAGVPVVGDRQPAIVDPTGGATVDDVARATIAGILAALRTHGLIAS
ncbi:MAG: DUF2793 domain-containing protein [Sphingomonas sp.]|nr:DUF2793 domain-containing protein [Sphingomonas sp.]